MGKIFINNSFAKNFISLKNNLGYVSQDLKLIDGSIKENIIFGSDINNLSREEINKRLHRCSVATNSHTFINKLKRKLNTKIYEDGKNLSAGQRQRILIARSIFNNPKLLVMDEPTSALDKLTENEIVQNLIKNKLNKTLIIASHSVDIINLCDRVFEVKNGKINEITL